MRTYPLLQRAANDPNKEVHSLARELMEKYLEKVIQPVVLPTVPYPGVRRW